MKRFGCFVFALVLLSACGERAHKKQLDSSYQMIEGDAQGTSYHITYSDKAGRNFQSAIDSVLSVIDNSMSTYVDSSIVSKCNRNESNCEIDEHMLRVFWKSNEVFYLTGGDFDPTVKPLIDFWGFGTSQITTEDAIDTNLVDSLLRYVGLDHIRLFDKKEGKVIEYLSDREFGPAENYELLKDGRTELDFNAIAQGYTVDVICELFESYGTVNYLVEVGGELRVKGKNAKGEEWKVGIDKPEEERTGKRSLQAVMTLKNKAIATSGNYRKFKIKDGVKYSHTLSAKTGYPVRHQILSATVIADDCMTADAYATAFMVMGHEKAIQFLKDHSEELEGYLVYSDEAGNFLTYMTPKLNDRIEEQID